MRNTANGVTVPNNIDVYAQMNKRKRGGAGDTTKLHRPEMNSGKDEAGAATETEPTTTQIDPTRMNELLTLVFSDGGKEIKVSRSTLCLIKGSALERQFGGRWGLQKDTHGRVLVGYNAHIFVRTVEELELCENDPSKMYSGQWLQFPKDKALSIFWSYLLMLKPPQNPYFHGSKILQRDSYKDPVHEMLGAALHGSRLLYTARSFTRGNAFAFHEACDACGATVTIMRSSDGSIFGGYSPVTWNGGGSLHGGYTDAPGAFLFTVKNPHGITPTKFEANPLQHDVIYRSPEKGPSFGNFDLVCNLDGQKSMVRFPQVFVDTTGKGSTLFTGTKNFHIETIEVWSVEFEGRYIEV